MARYRLRREHVQYSEPIDHRPGIIRLRGTQNGLLLTQIFWKDLPASTFGRPATILIRMRDDPTDSDFVICETRDVILDRGPDELGPAQ